jgi:hypothetical protein
MRNFLSLFLALLITLAVIKPQTAHAEMPVKAKAILTMAGYGAAGGALLGLATMAFGNTSSSVAKGASLGLYAGLLFGAYVLVSHHQRQAGSYDDNASPYQESSDVYGDEYNAEEGGEADPDDRSKRGGFFDRFEIMQEHMHNQSFTFDSEKRKGGNLPPIQMNVFQYNF